MNITVSSEITARAKLAANLLAASMEVFLAGYKSITDYGRRLRGLTRGLWNGELDKFRFVDDVFSAMTRAFNQAWTEGARTQGVEPSERTPEEEAKLQEMINTQATFIPGLADWILAHAKDGPPPDITPMLEEPISGAPQELATVGKAQEYAKNELGIDVDYSQIDIDRANAMNKTVYEMQDKYEGRATELSKIDFDSNVGYTARWRGDKITINPDTFTNEQIQRTNELTLNRHRSSVDRLDRIKIELEANREFWHIDDIQRMEFQISNLEKRIKETTTMRFTVGNNIDEILVHEFGHGVHFDLVAGEHENITDFLAPSRQRDLGLIPQEQLGMKLDSIARTQGFNLSEYATTDGGEYFAEAFTSFMRGETANINKELLGIFEELIK